MWVLLLLDKYADYRPTYRLLGALRRQGLALALGTVPDGLRRLLPLLEPVYEALRGHLQPQHHWHGDETRWQVFATVEGKVGHLWQLWLVLSAEVAVCTLAAGRGHEVPEAVLDAERGPVVGRKNYYGSGAVWAGQLAAVMFSIVETVRLWRLNAQAWLTDYLRACAEAGGRTPPELRRWLPGMMTAGERAAWKVVGPAAAPRPEDSS